MTRPNLSSADIDRLRQEVAVLTTQLSATQAELDRALVAASGWQVGDEVEVAHGSAWVPAIIRYLYVSYGRVRCDVSYRSSRGGWQSRQSHAWGEIRKPVSV